MESYHLKWIPWNSGKIPIVMQSRNGPCPLIATINVLLLREKVRLPEMLEQITADQLLTYLGESIMDSVPPAPTGNPQEDESAILNFEQHINDAMEILPKLKNGLDVNIRFTGIEDFEYTPEHIIFDLLRIPVYHGWLVDPSLDELKAAIGGQSYNQLMDRIVESKNNSNTTAESSVQVMIAEEFLEHTASQLTHYGLTELKSKIRDNEIGVLFRNNHFLTLLKREGEIYTLVTDHGYLTIDNVIWESLDNIDGAGRYFDANFQESEVINSKQLDRQLDRQLQVSKFKEPNENNNTNDNDTNTNNDDPRQKQLNDQLLNDFLLALSIKEEEAATANEPRRVEEDFELAKRLQEEEDNAFKTYEEMTRSSQRVDQSGGGGGGSSRDADIFDTSTTTTAAAQPANQQLQPQQQQQPYELDFPALMGREGPSKAVAAVATAPEKVQPHPSQELAATAATATTSDEVSQLPQQVSSSSRLPVNEPAASSSWGPPEPQLQPQIQRAPTETTMTTTATSTAKVPRSSRQLSASRQSVKSEKNPKESSCKII